MHAVKKFLWTGLHWGSTASLGGVLDQTDLTRPDVGGTLGQGSSLQGDVYFNFGSIMNISSSFLLICIFTI